MKNVRIDEKRKTLDLFVLFSLAFALFMSYFQYFKGTFIPGQLLRSFKGH